MSALSPTMLVGAQLAAAHALYNQIDKGPGTGPGVLETWSSVEHLAQAVMLQPPASLDDVLLQIATAACWAGVVADAIDDNTGVSGIARAIERAAQSAAIFLNRATRLPDGRCADYVADQVRQLIGCGAELAGSRRLDDDRRLPWSEAHGRYVAAKAAADAASGTLDADPLVEAECQARDDLIEKVPAPDGRALATKIIMARQCADGIDVSVMFADHAVAILADARRLGGDA